MTSGNDVAGVRRCLGGSARVWILNAGLVAAAATAYFGFVRGLPAVAAPLRIPWPAFAGAFCCTEVFVVHLHFRREAHSFSLSEIPLVGALLFLAPGVLVPVQLLGAGVALIGYRRQSPIKLVFNLAHFALEGCLASLIFHAVLSSASATRSIGPLVWIAAFLATVVTSSVSAVTIVGAISLSEGCLFDLGKLSTVGASALIVALTNTSLALIGVAVLWHAPIAACLVAVPTGMLMLAYRAYFAERRQKQSIEFLYESTLLLHRSHELEPGIIALLSHAREMFSADIAEITLLPAQPGEPALRTAVGPGERSEVMVPIKLDLAAAILTDVTEGKALLIPRAHRGQQAGVLADRGIRDAMVAVLKGEKRVVGTMLVANCLSDVATFCADDLRLFETLTNQVSIMLEKGRLETSLAQLRELQDRLEHQAFHDTLTDLPNRALFVDRIEHALARRRRFDGLLGVLFLDLDDFKTINDSLGHGAGDQLLESVAFRLRACLRASDTAARLGGDEFAVLIEDMNDPAEAVALAERVIAALRTPFPVQGSEVVIRCSIGIAVSSSADDDVYKLLSNADVAMYDAKTRGKGRYEVFEPSMRLQVLKRHEYNAALRRALEGDQFVLNYQPMVDLRTGEVVAVEALLRWEHPDQGVLPAGEFIPVAEETGQIVPIGRWVLEEACAQVAQIQSVRPEGKPLVLSVNLSARQLHHDGLVEDIVDLLDRTGFDPRNLVLEITESVLMHDTEETIAVLTALKAVGVRVAIDDFGTGYSSLSYLRWLPVDVLKIAQPFIDALRTGEEPAAFVDAIVHMGHTLNLEVVAEGVETVEQLDLLRRVGCNMGQGFYFSRPVDSVATTFLQGWHGDMPERTLATPDALVAG